MSYTSFGIAAQLSVPGPSGMQCNGWVEDKNGNCCPIDSWSDGTYAMVKGAETLQEKKEQEARAYLVSQSEAPRRSVGTQAEALAVDYELTGPALQDAKALGNIISSALSAFNRFFPAWRYEDGPARPSPVTGCREIDSGWGSRRVRKSFYDYSSRMREQMLNLARLSGLSTISAWREKVNQVVRAMPSLYKRSAWGPEGRSLDLVGGRIVIVSPWFKQLVGLLSGSKPGMVTMVMAAPSSTPTPKLTIPSGMKFSPLQKRPTVTVPSGKTFDPFPERGSTIPPGPVPGSSIPGPGPSAAQGPSIPATTPVAPTLAPAPAPKASPTAAAVVGGGAAAAALLWLLL